MGTPLTTDDGVAPTATASLVRGARWLTGASVLVGLVNYAYSLALTHVLPVAGFAVFAAGQALLLTAGTVSGTSISWVLAQALVRARDARQRSRAIWFSLVLNAGLGLVAGLGICLVASRFASTPIALLLGGAAALVFLSSTTVGLLQGNQRLDLLAALNVTEVLVKIVIGLALVALGLGAGGAFTGFVAGSLVLVLVGLVSARHEIRPTRGALRHRELWRPALGVAGVQGSVAVLAAADLVLIAVLAADAAEASTYQASMILSRVPLFLAAAVSTSVFPLIARDPERSSEVMAKAVQLYLALALPYTAALVTVPDALLALVLPAEYAGLGALLPATASAGLLLGAVGLLATFFQAHRAYRAGIAAQVIGVCVHVGALLTGFELGGVLGLAVGAAVGLTVNACALVLAAPRSWRRDVRWPWPVLLGSCALAGVLLLLRGEPAVWLAVAVLAGVVTAARGLGRVPRAEPVLRP